MKYDSAIRTVNGEGTQQDIAKAECGRSWCNNNIFFFLILTWTVGYSTGLSTLFQFFFFYVHQLRQKIMNLIHLFFTQEKKFISALDKLDVLQNTSFQVPILFVNWLIYID